MHEWIGRLASRCDIMQDLTREHRHPSTYVSDFYDGEAVQAFQAHDGSHFIEGLANELQMVFSLGMDGFNPFGHSAHSSAQSVTAVYMICLLLSPEIRNLTAMYLSHTAIHAQGVLCHIALIPLVCDLLAAWQMAGLAGHSASIFCSFCYIRLDKIENLDMATWIPRDAKTHRKKAEDWLNATT